MVHISIKTVYISSLKQGFNKEELNGKYFKSCTTNQITKIIIKYRC